MLFPQAFDIAASGPAGGVGDNSSLLVDAELRSVGNGVLTLSLGPGFCTYR